MVHDDDNPVQPWKIPPEDEPLSYTPTRDVHLIERIIELAQDNPNWGPLTIHEVLVADGDVVDESVVNYVLREYRMPNLHL